MHRSSHKVFFQSRGSGKYPKIELDRVYPTHVNPKFCAWCSTALQKKFFPFEKMERLWCANCGFITYLNPYPVAGTIPERGNKIILLKRGIEPRKGKWTYPAGFVELFETIPSAAIRETREETGLQVKLNSLVGVYSYPGFSVATIVYSAEVLRGRFRTCLETEKIREFSKEEIPWKELAFRSTWDALKDWLKGRRHRGVEL